MDFNRSPVQLFAGMDRGGQGPPEHRALAQEQECCQGLLSALISQGSRVILWILWITSPSQTLPLFLHTPQKPCRGEMCTVSSDLQPKHLPRVSISYPCPGLAQALEQQEPRAREASWVQERNFSCRKIPPLIFSLI